MLKSGATGKKTTGRSNNEIVNGLPIVKVNSWPMFFTNTGEMCKFAPSLMLPTPKVQNEEVM